MKVTIRAVQLLVLTTLLLAGCSSDTAADEASTPSHRPQRAGQPIDPLRTAAHLSSARVAAMTGDQAGVQRNAEAIAEDMRRAMKMPDARRPIDHEAARSIVRALPGVVSAAWIDRTNFLVRVDSAQARSERTIDEICHGLESLGDTLAVVVHLQFAAPATRDGMDTLSRNCQLPMGEHAFMHRPLRMDVLDPAVRAQHRAKKEALERRPPANHTEGDRAALEAIPEM